MLKKKKLMGFARLRRLLELSSSTGGEKKPSCWTSKGEYFFSLIFFSSD